VSVLGGDQPVRAPRYSRVVTHRAKVDAFRALHVRGQPLLIPNPWDAGSARLLASLGFQALATTSSGHAATLGRLDGMVDREEALAHAASIVAAVDVTAVASPAITYSVPVSADLENGFADDPDGVFATVAEAAGVGLAGCSIEDFTGRVDEPIYAIELATERVAAAARAAHADPGLVLTARAENFVRGNPDLDDTIARLQAYQAAGADVLYAPGLARLDDIRRVVGAVERPVNVLVRPGLATVAELADAGVARISVGGAFSWVAFAALRDAGRELLESGTYSFLELAAAGRTAATAAFRDCR
jgi:2-methylisocitrate lyase-like PEP mutase family enzyme